jgi:DNA replication protein DnaC
MKAYHPRVKWLLKTRGVGPRLLEALDLEPILRFPEAPMGAGMAGASGAGKTFAMVRHLADRAQAIVESYPNPDDALWPSRAALWVSWTQKSEELKRWVGAGQGEAVDEWIELAKLTKRLYLDDLGRERVTGANDYALGVLREVLDYRHTNLLPVYWTTNLNATDLSELYLDKALIGRIVEAWPPVRVGGSNLRLAQSHAHSPSRFPLA